MDYNSGLKTWQWVVTAIVIIVLIVIGIFLFGNSVPRDIDVGAATTPAPVEDRTPKDDTPFTFVVKDSNGNRYTTHAYIILDNCVRFRDESDKRIRVCGNYTVNQE